MSVVLEGADEGFAVQLPCLRAQFVVNGGGELAVYVESNFELVPEGVE